MRSYSKLIKVLVLGLIFLFCLSGCEAVKPESKMPPAESRQNLSKEEIPVQAMALIESFEHYGMAESMADSITSEEVIDLGFSYLKGRGLLEEFQTANDTVEIPYKLLYQMGSFLFSGTKAPLEETLYDSDRTYSSDYYSQNHTLTLTSAKWENEKLELSFSRYQDTIPLNNVSYTLVKADAKNCPVEVEADCYQIERVANEVVSLNPNPQTIEISSVEELVKLSQDFKERGALLIDNTYLLTADLDCSGIDFPPIGQNISALRHINENIDPSQPGFNAVFDGQGHTIKGLHISVQDTSDTPAGAGLFARIGIWGKVKNLTLTEAFVETTDASYSTGLLAGICEGEIVNCHVQGKASGINNIGGLVGELHREIWDFENYETGMRALLKDSSADVQVTGYSSVGGMAGSIYNANVENCRAAGTVTGLHKEEDAYTMQTPFEIGGFTGTNFFTAFFKCETSAALNIKSTGSWIGSFSGSAYHSKASQCSYDRKRAGGWQVIDVIDDIDATDFTDYDIIGK